MATNKMDFALRTGACIALLAMWLTGCGAPPLPPPAPPPAAPAAQPAPEGPAPPAAEPTEPASAPKAAAANTSAAEPDIDTMTVATPNAKMSIPVDLRYQFDGGVLPNQPVTLHLAVVSRMPATNLQVNVKEASGLQVAAGALGVQKAAGAANVYRRDYSITRTSDADSAGLSVLVTMDMPVGTGFGYFTVPFDAGPNPQNKQDSVKQR